MTNMTISDIKDMLSNVPVCYLEDKLDELKSDERLGVKKLIDKYEKKIEAYEKEVERIIQMKAYENKYPDKKYICGIDEVGRGPLSGPVVSAAVILPKDVNILYINDSKKLTEAKREELYDIIMEKAIAVSVGMANVDVIDDINILNATYESMISAIDSLEIKPDMILVDAVTIPRVKIPQEPIIKGDAKSISIAAASIIAKVYRDRLMKDYDQLFPEYKFAKNKGYGTQEHIEALKEHGPCPIHRKSFIKSIL
ncbi:ribonuclease HII [Vallitalea guaymasensis]|uniref:Ribonuclease HII n=1 Tax=Vallitalea guaymasensis TaxID=1185412 RepID=A0A8J8SA39_9FIRM|nr:ribonuclease HII [Vallitalea guaymasensis]QUH27398.1 ribonuclease HII [Vallitalea guaymasensis]